MIDPGDAPLGQDCGRVHDLAFNRIVVPNALGKLADKPHDHRRGIRSGGQSTENSEVLQDEPFAQNQVFGRVAGHRQLGYQEHVGLLRGSPGHRLQNPRLVSGEVADREIDLGPGDPKVVGHRPATVSSIRWSTMARIASSGSAPPARASL